MTDEITITRPDDFHCHFRDDAYLSRTVPDASMQFARVLVMPNLKPPVITVSDALHYRDRILAHLPANRDFTPLMTLYLSEKMMPDLIIEAKKSDVVVACKLYPAGATTHSEAGIADLKSIYPLLEQMQAVDLPLCVHGESIDSSVDVFDREKQFLTESLQPLLKHFPNLRVILEHISTKLAVQFVLSGPKNLAATITPHHLYYNRNDIFKGGIRPHYYCLPILKRKKDQVALIEAATSGHPKFFLGTDSAPHRALQKENSCGCAGIYSSHAALSFYAEIFEKADALNQLENFASRNGALFYGLPFNRGDITLVKKSLHIPATLPFGADTVVPMSAGETLSWQIQSS